MSRTSLFAWCALVILPVGVAVAQPTQDYRCTIQRVETAEAPPNRSHDLEKRTYIGREFTVERRTGLMAGALKNAYLTSPQVIDIGSNENSFKVVTTMRKEQGAGAGSNAYLLTINEYVGTPKKPFIFVANDVAYFGTCTHF